MLPNVPVVEVEHGEHKAQIFKCISLPENAEDVVDDPAPNPAATEVSLTQRQPDVNTLEALQGPAADELGHKHGLWCSGEPWRQTVDDKAARLQDGEALGGDTATEEEDGRGPETAMVPGKVFLDARSLFCVMCIDGLVVWCVELF